MGDKTKQTRQRAEQASKPHNTTHTEEQLQHALDHEVPARRASDEPDEEDMGQEVPDREEQMAKRNADTKRPEDVEHEP